MIKKIILSILVVVTLLVLSLTAVIFFRPGLIINPKNLSFVLHKTNLLKSWHWKNAKFTHEWVKWNDRNFSGQFEGFCLIYTNPTLDLDTCLDDISWNVNLKFNLDNVLHVTTNDPLKVISSHTKIVTREDKKAEKETPPDIYKYWSLFWSDLIPDMEISMKKIHFKDFNENLAVTKTRKSFSLKTNIFLLQADPDGFVLHGPKSYPIRTKLPLAQDPISLIDVKLTGSIRESGIPLELNGNLESINFVFNSFLDLPLKDDFSSVAFQKKMILSTKGKLRLNNIRENMKKYGPEPYNELPAPFNVMDGYISADISTKNSTYKDEVIINNITHFRLKSAKQSLQFDILADVPLKIKDYKISSIHLGVDFLDVLIQLPRLSKKSPPPQFMPDGRFKKTIVAKKKKPDHNPKEINLNVSASDANPLQLRTNLLDEILKMSFDLKIENSKMSDGFLKIHPLKTYVFKRPIKLQEFMLKFDELNDPVLDALILFPLPEYKIKLKLEGPVSKPRYAFESDPPLPQNDIYAVLLFGRPLADLDPDDKTAANKTNQLLSQGILSLSVLYFLAGSPVEYIGYDPGSKNATAQFGLGNKSSLRVGGGQEGINSTAIRRSLGNGWYLDTSVQSNAAGSTNSSSQARNYGVLLERIISY